jgi:hypothetical protein
MKQGEADTKDADGKEHHHTEGHTTAVDNLAKMVRNIDLI